MQYLGGKSRVKSFLQENILPLSKGRRLIEPFCGGMSATVALLPDLASDASVPLISMIVALQQGWVPPSVVTEDEYKRVKDAVADTDPLKAFVGFGCSFGGKYFAGYCRDGTGRNYALNAKNSLLKKIEKVRNVEFSAKNYFEIDAQRGDVIYCDPPYVNTTQGYSTGLFDTSQFWQWCRDTADKGCTVVVSEFTAPSDIPVLCSKLSKTDLQCSNRTSTTVENLYILDGF
jgi:DNA adenine methylase